MRKYRLWISREKLTTVSIPKDRAEALKALAALLDEGDEELRDFLESRSIALPPLPPK